ncbi:MAG: AraC family transcriptional regulator [Lentisphaeraceae bacterium]|nr:AraC family transcriptional regulator [Lentisphaeraceae bacterium]
MHPYQKDFFDQVADPKVLLDMFDYCSHANLVIKDLDSRFIIGTQVWAEMVGARDREDFIGKCDYDYFTQYLSDLYIAEDKTVFAGEAYKNRRWLVPQRKSFVAWCLASKWPIYSKTGEVIGLCCSLTHFSKADSQYQEHFGMPHVVEYIEANYMKEVSIQTLADIACLSVSQFNRNFKKIFRITPSDYITHTRLNSASQDLINTTKSITQVSSENGFYDSSYFAKQFKKQFHCSPGQYRKNNKG